MARGSAGLLTSQLELGEPEIVVRDLELQAFDCAVSVDDEVGSAAAEPGKGSVPVEDEGVVVQMAEPADQGRIRPEAELQAPVLETDLDRAVQLAAVLADVRRQRARRRSTTGPLLQGLLQPSTDCQTQRKRSTMHNRRIGTNVMRIVCSCCFPTTDRHFDFCKVETGLPIPLDNFVLVSCQGLAPIAVRPIIELQAF